MEPDEFERRVGELERAEADYRARQDRQVDDLTQRLEIVERFLAERFG